MAGRIGHYLRDLVGPANPAAPVRFARFQVNTGVGHRLTGRIERETSNGLRACQESARATPATGQRRSGWWAPPARVPRREAAALCDQHPRQQGCACIRWHRLKRVDWADRMCSCGRLPTRARPRQVCRLASSREPRPFRPLRGQDPSRICPLNPSWRSPIPSSAPFRKYPRRTPC